MIQSILIGKLIYNELSLNLLIKEKLTSNINGEKKLKVYPLIANSKTTIPFITYKKDNVINHICKDGYYEDIVLYSISISDINYNTTCEIANVIRSIFDRQMIQYNDITIYNSKMVGIEEIWNDENFVQILSFECKVVK